MSAGERISALEAELADVRSQAEANFAMAEKTVQRRTAKLDATHALLVEALDTWANLAPCQCFADSTCASRAARRRLREKMLAL